MSKRENGWFIGRFQPAHAGHISDIKIASSQVDRLNILIGSANACRSIKNPWTYQERVDMLRKRLFQEGIENVSFFPVNDYPYNNHRWITEVLAIVDYVSPYAPMGSDKNILFGAWKEGNDYLNWFPQLRYRSLPIEGTVNSTDIRIGMMTTEDPSIPSTVLDDYKFFQKERELFKDYPFPETLNFNCSDAVVTCLGHVLLIQRKFAPGRGAWALPGGFRNAKETFLQCAVRELREETNLRVPERVLLGSVKSSKLYDNPNRSYGIPRNTLAVHFDIAPDAGVSLPRANGADDASKAVWVPLNEAVNTYTMYDDHSDIIQELTGVSRDFAYLKV